MRGLRLGRRGRARLVRVLLRQPRFAPPEGEVEGGGHMGIGTSRRGGGIVSWAALSMHLPPNSLSL
eukprot:4612300-Alexandrium_andersonii.AAC.1